MDTVYKSRFLNPKQLTLSVLILGIFGGAATLLVLNALYQGNNWYVFIESPVVKYIFLYIIGLIIAGLYFARDYYFLNNLEVSFKDEFINFNGKWVHKDFYVADLRDYKPSRVIYGWFKKEKHIIKFKDRRDHRKYNMFVVFNKKEALDFEKALLEARKSVMQ